MTLSELTVWVAFNPRTAAGMIMERNEMKQKPADIWFSKCVRRAKKYTCEKCGKQFKEGDSGLHCSHIFPRTVRSLRWCKDNAQALCYVCHKGFFHDQPSESGKWVEEYLGQGMMEILREKRNQIAKITKKEEKEIATHYRKEYQRMVSEDSYEFTSYQ